MKTILGYPNYAVTRDGRVYSRSVKRFLVPQPSDKGYLSVILRCKGKAKRLTVSSLVLNAFVGPRPLNKQSRFLDNDRTNNNLDNLCWGTKKEAQANSKQRGTRIDNKGEQNGVAKLTESDVLEIRELYTTGLYSHRAISEEYPVVRETIGSICRRGTWKHICLMVI